MCCELQVGGRVEEVEVWQDLANVYIELKQWRDVELALEKAQALNKYSATTWCATGGFILILFAISSGQVVQFRLTHAFSYSQANSFSVWDHLRLANGVGSILYQAVLVLPAMIHPILVRGHLVNLSHCSFNQLHGNLGACL